MHDTDTCARMPASGSTAAQPPINEVLHRFDKEREVAFKDETYVVRDNGAVLRRGRSGARRRRLDDFWTFGSLNKHTGYLVLCDHVIHQIVATAFHAARPSTDHVVDHIDTNRLNNRAENLRWVTRLENVLLNPITRKRIELVYGSLDEFFANPGARSVPNLEWMRTVTKEQAAESLARLLRWSGKEGAPQGGALGDWLFAPRSRVVPEPEPELRDMPSLTPGALQRKWRTPTEFPQCPEGVSSDALDDYFARLPYGSIFARNRYGESIVVTAGKGKDNTLSVLCNTRTGVKEWTLARIVLEGAGFCHEAGSTFFTLQGALKAHCRAIGEPFEESIDDCA